MQLIDKLVANLGTWRTNDKDKIGETLTISFPKMEYNVPSTTLTLSLPKDII